MRADHNSSLATRIVLGLVLALIGAAISSCYDTLTTAPESLRRLPPSTWRSDELTPLPSSSTPLGPGPNTRTLITVYPFTEGIVVEGKITGMVTILSDPYALHQFTAPLDYRGYSQSDTWGTQCGMNATFFTWATGNLTGCGGSGSVWKDTVFLRDSVFAKRGPGILSGAAECGAAPCYTYPTSSQELTLTPIAAGLKVTASNNFLTLAQMTAYYAPYTRFSTAAVPAFIHGIPTPKRFLQRAWHRADAPSGYTTDMTYCAAPSSVCDLPVRESGIYWTKERVNGVEREDSVAINCFFGDSLIDNLPTRKALMDALDSSNYKEYWRNRKESGFAIAESLTQPGKFDVVWTVDPQATPCATMIPSVSPTGIPGWKVRAYVHIHPPNIYEETSCSYPETPSDSITGYPVIGLSDRDLTRMDSINLEISTSYAPYGWSPVPFYVMDPDWIYRQGPGQPADFTRDTLNAHRWNGGGKCKWVRPTRSQVPNFLNMSIAFSKQVPNPIFRP